MKCELANLETIAYVVFITPATAPDTELYYAGHWPDPELHQKYKDGYKVSVYNEIYYTTELSLAKVYYGAIAAQRIAKEIRADRFADTPVWLAARVLPIKEQEVFKAKLKGPDKVKQGNGSWQTRVRNVTARAFGKQQIFEELK